MSIHVALHHRTHYQYDRPVALGPQIVRLRPAPHARTRILSYSLRILPEKHFINWQQDPQSNYLARLVFLEKSRELSVEVDLVAEMSVLNPFDFFLEPRAERFPFEYEDDLEHDLEPFRKKCELSPLFQDYLAVQRKDLQTLVTGSPGSDKDSRPRTIDFLVSLNRSLWRDIKYLIRLEPGVQTPEQTLKKRSGSCRDSAWLLCQLFRHLGVAARFVSGYLIQLKPDLKSLDGPSGTEQDFTDLHAWCEVYLPGGGWIGLDPTSGLFAGEGHIPLAATADPQSAAPVSGMVEDCKSEFKFEMKVARVFESPRVTKPYSEAQWQDIQDLGHKVDDALRQKDCRLTMGGEPTFVSIDDMDGAEWNSVALGPKKRGLADDLMRRLKSQFTQGALLHYGQGKWYPGESLPRWAFACYWRKDGQPVWNKEELFALESRNYGHDETRAEKFIRALANRLGCSQDHVLPAFEDAWYYLWKERRLPTNVDPFKSNLKIEEDRARLAKVFEQGLEKAVGFILPIERRSGAAGNPLWLSGKWHFRSGRCYLIPGDSPIGLRLPLESLPWVATPDYPYVHQQDPMEPRSPLASWEALSQRFLPGGIGTPPLHRERGPSRTGEVSSPDGHRGQIESSRIPGRGESASWIVRSALCVEPRQGRLHVFMPPVRTLDDYLELVVAVELTAEQLATPIVMEGYTPPHDPRLNVLKITPDPGVIEVNMHPTRSWDEMVTQTEALYEAARQSRLGTEKFMLDGRHTGTGGGNHIVIGGATPADSPLLRRPDLLRSLVGYWQNHPSLSFLFSGLFIGPTSQSPRVDEARNDSLYELELAFRQVPFAGDKKHGASSISPWLVDRLFRNLLIDATGNTHRSEFCIDKLYSPDSSSGRLGLLEMRAFEMPPHARMSLAQQLLLRTLISKFWDQPYTNQLVRWGTDIHDRWMLPHFVWTDFEDVIEDLRANGYPVHSEWFAPHFEFRFPQIGNLELKNIEVSIRHALEPWHVLGEDPGPGGTVRYVDSSLERVQVKARGLVGSRHAISVGGTIIPMHPTGTNGEYVAGVRFRAWQPPNCLQPNIKVHAPLIFDVLDTWNGRSLGGCTYHVAHPGGLGYSTFPVNAYEAESRRLSRFFRQGHSPGVANSRASASSPEFPFTLDLRQGAAIS